MSVLFDEIRSTSKTAAKVLFDAGFSTDSEIQSLTRTDLNELFPGIEKLKLRRKIFEIIQKQKPIDLLLKDMNEYIPKECSHSAQMNDEVLATHLQILKDISTQVKNVQTSLDAHISLLENLNKNLSDLKANRDFLSGTGTSATSVPIEAHCSQNSGYQQQGKRSWFPFSTLSYSVTPQKKGTVTYKMLVTGVTFNAHLQLLEKVKAMSHDCDLVRVNREDSPSNQNYLIIIVFCPIISRVGTDVQAAMHDVEGDKPIILVLMHHVHEARNTSTMKTWGDGYNVVLQVDVFFHGTASGLLDCQQNNKAATGIKNKLLEYKIMKS
ncbi:hypothetical protein EXN66_Car018420 [Channa argus]|uniref:Uncharacterized protein n=1 Tax=Channa argus TaxID=215402 RepID=A0A6G1QJK8_CHAAH|nr:hypothetical protein EXN66_Car018420 [Channa argus]